MVKKTIALAALSLIPAVLAIPIEAVLRARIDENTLYTPTRFYARPIVFRPGGRLDAKRVERSLRNLGYRSAHRSRIRIGEYGLSAHKLTVGRHAFRHLGQLDPGGVATVWIGYGGRIVDIEDARGRSLRYLSLEPELIGAAYGPSREDRVPVPLSQVPQHLVDAVLSVEDQRFFEHNGLDLRGILRATVADLRAKRIVQGASTVTQQLAKNLFLSPRRSPIRKLREMALALMLEHRYSKERILETYLNQIYLGQRGSVAIHGVARAAQFYFGKDVTQLGPSEAALLAGIIRGPSLYAPRRHPKAARERRNLVLRLMHERDAISDREYRRAKKRSLELTRAPSTRGGGQYFVDFASKRLAVSTVGRRPANGVAVFTTLDMNLQRSAEVAIRSGLRRLERRYPRLKRGKLPLQAALVALDPRTGKILAMVGGRDYGKSQFNRAVAAHRQPGSAFKPVVALAALSSARGFTLASLIQDEPLSVEMRGGGRWEPQNYDHEFRGAVSMREAIEHSLNVPFARLGLAVGPGRIAQTARALGIESRLNVVPSLALGASEVTPLELTRAFGVMAANGFRSDIHSVLGVLDNDGNIREGIELRGEQVYDPAQVYLITSALRGVVERGTGRSLRTLGYLGPVAVKSGTTNNYRDAWFVGYTPSLAVGVWVGFDDGKSIGLSGSRAALPIFARFLIDAVGPYGGEEFHRPRGLEIVEVNQRTGLAAGRGCRGQPELFVRGTAPTTSCSPSRVSRRRRGQGRASHRYRALVRLLEQAEHWRGRRN
ncbi:MAG: transglycosylase domain-containing protein [Gemmatimonadales bacterium]